MTVPQDAHQSASPIKLLLRLLGWLLTLVCCLYVGWKLWNNNEQLQSLSWTGARVGALLGATLLWVVANTCIGLGWRWMLATTGGSISFRHSIALSWRTQAAKYLPGNVFHLAGRIWLARDYGIGTKQSSLATALESLCLIALAACIGLPLLLPVAGPTPMILFGTVLLIAMGLLLSRPAHAWVGRHWGLRELPPPPRQFALLARATLAYLAMLLVQTSMFVLIAETILPRFAWTLLHSIQAVVTAWVAGFVIIGSPGGLGVREVVMGWLADGTVSQTSLLLVAALMRCCSILGDLICLPLGRILDATRSDRNCNN